MVATVVGIMALVTGLANAWPQVVRIIARRTSAGVSALTWAMTLFAAITWSILGFVQHIGLTVAYNLLAAGGAAAVLLVLVRLRVLAMWRLVVIVVAALFANAVAYAVGGPRWISVLAVGVAVCMFVPQASAVLRSSTEGVSPIGWALSSASASLWVVYGVLINHLEVSAPGVVMAPVAAMIVWRVRSAAAALPVGA